MTNKIGKKIKIKINNKNKTMKTIQTLVISAIKYKVFTSREYNP